MIELKRNSKTPGLLVSVRNEAEALTALAAGADVIDVKEPDRGPLGAADERTIAAVVRAVDGRAPVTAAMGELFELTTAGHIADRKPIPTGVSLFKIGLASCYRIPDWQTRWRDATGALQGHRPNAASPVAVAYADWRAAGAPEPDDVLKAALRLHCPALLIDTWDKSAGGLFDHWPVADLHAFIDRVRSQNLAIVLAGSLTGDNFLRAAQLGPDLVAVRGAACEAGRNSTVSIEQVRTLKQMLASSHKPSRPRPALRQ